jgi:NADH-quinone oxidoreductase subunit E
MSESFEFTPNYLEQAKTAMAKYPEGRQQSAVLALLDLAQRQNEDGHYVTAAAVDTISEMLDMARIRVMEVATFFTMINLQPVGKYLLQCCTTTPCWLRGSGPVHEAIQFHLGIHNGETTDDGLFTLMEVECLGACTNAPIVQVNDDYYEDLDADKVVGLLDAFKRGEKPERGPQNGRRNSAPIGGPQTLVDMKFGGD